MVIPEVAYPTYEVGAVLAGLAVRRADVPPADAAGIVLVWLNSPGNPHGRVLTDDQLREWVGWGRAHGIPVVADECYITLGWDVEPRSLLHPAIAGADHAGLLAVHSLSKQSNAAGYRAGLLSGDPELVRRIWDVRRHLGLLVPGPVQAAMAAALADDAHVDAQRERYRARRDRLAAAVRGGGAADRPLRGRPVPVGHPGRGLLDDDRLARRPGHRRRAGQLLRPGRVAARPPRAHRDRRAHRRRSAADSGLTSGGRVRDQRPRSMAGRGGQCRDEITARLPSTSPEVIPRSPIGCGPSNAALRHLNGRKTRRALCASESDPYRSDVTA